MNTLIGEVRRVNKGQEGGSRNKSKSLIRIEERGEQVLRIWYI